MPKAQFIEEKKLLHFINKKKCPVKDIVKGLDRQTSGWETLFEKHIFNKERVSTRYRKLLNLNHKEISEWKHGKGSE